MAEFIVNVWNGFDNDAAFEATLPLALHGRRIAALGQANRIGLVFLHGLDRLSPAYRDRLRNLGFTIEDASALAAELEPRLGVLREHWKHWGGIRHFGLLRFLVMARLFRGQSIITFDADMILNAPFAALEAAVGEDIFFLGGSSCFAAIPARSDFFAVLEDHIARLLRDPETYAREVAELPSAEALFDPMRLNGTDQGIIALLQRRRIVANGPGTRRVQESGLLPFANLLGLHNRGLRDLAYERRAGVDYLGGKPVMIWHMSNDLCAHLGQFIFLRDWLGEEAVPLFGRLPVPRTHYGIAGGDPVLGTMFAAVAQAAERYRLAELTGRSPFARERICRLLFEESDFGFILDDRVWHTPGVFRARGVVTPPGSAPAGGP